MHSSTEDTPASPSSTGGFQTTRWTIVAAAQDRQSPENAVAWETLARRYWQPVHVYILGCGHGAHDAQDLTQEFFSRLYSRDYLRAADPAKGRFRTFLRVAARRFLINDWDRRRALKRGGGQEIVSLDAMTPDERQRHEPADEASAERIFERRWALTLLERALARLRDEYARAGRETEFAELKEQLTAARAAVDHAALAARLGVSEGAARVALHRLRKRLRAHFRAEVADTVDDDAEIEAELRHVIRLLGEN